MKIIGLIGGMSWESSLEYYRIVNEKTKALLGGLSSSHCLLYSVNFAEIETLQHQGDWEQLNVIMADAATKLYQGGAELIVLCTNTMHLCSNAIQKAVPIPFLHIAEATGERIVQRQLKKVGLLGTKFTMEKDFYKNVLKEGFQVETIVPNAEDQAVVHRIIYEELVLGNILDTSRVVFQEVIQRLQARGAEGVILGCTEIPLLIGQSDVEIPVFDTTRIHAEKAVEWAIK
jgi:aspartate racemase